jgi:ankyrin repeat protein
MKQKLRLKKSPEERTESALHIAARENNVQRAELLLYFNPDFNALNHQGLTPLALALIQRNTDMVIFLIDVAVGTKISENQAYISDPTVEAFKALYGKDVKMMKLWDNFLKTINYYPLTDTSSQDTSLCTSSIDDSTTNIKEDTSIFMGEAFHHHDHSF